MMEYLSVSINTEKKYKQLKVLRNRGGDSLESDTFPLRYFLLSPRERNIKLCLEPGLTVSPLHSSPSYDGLPLLLASNILTSRADCSNADKPGAVPQHNGLTDFGKVK